MQLRKTIATTFAVSVMALTLTGCPHRHHDDNHPPPPPPGDRHDDHQDNHGDNH